MGALEGIVVALVIIFYIVRWIVLSVRAVFAAARKAFGSNPAITAEAARRRAMEQMRQQAPSQEAEARRPPERAAPNPRPQGRARRPEAGGPAVTSASGSAEFGTQIARLEAQEGPGMPAPSTPSNAPTTGGGLFSNGDDLVRAVILQEILAKPLSQRRRAARYTPVLPAPKQ